MKVFVGFAARSGVARFGTAAHRQSDSHLRYSAMKRYKNLACLALITPALNLDTIALLSH